MLRSSSPARSGAAGIRGAPQRFRNLFGQPLRFLDLYPLQLLVLEERPGHHQRVLHRVVLHGVAAHVASRPVPDGKAVFYQKHMAHHLLPEIDLDWLRNITNCFLIRDPREMILSLAKFIDAPEAGQTGLPQQVKVFELVREQSGETPPVIDAKDVLTDPGEILGKLCERVGVPSTDRMLAWAPGRRPTDGVWARHWYGAVEKSTGFAPYRPKNEPVPAHLQGLLEECEGMYQRLHAHRIV